MFDVLKHPLSSPHVCKYIFVVLWIGSIATNGFILKEFPIYFLFILASIFAGLGFYNQSKLVLLSIALAIAFTRIYFISNPFDAPIIHFLTYVSITFLSGGFMKNYQQTKENSIELSLALANSLDSRDPYTGTHSKNVANYAFELAKELNMSKQQCEVIKIGGLLHDIGKIGIPEAVLTKTGKLDLHEFNLIKKHPVIGYETLKHINGFRSNGVLDMVLYHHERYDGSGYPEGLSGERIPLVARIISVADAFDAMSSKRIYRKELQWDHLMNEFRSNRGTQFDPDITDVFMNLLEERGETILHSGGDRHHPKFVDY